MRASIAVLALGYASAAAAVGLPECAGKCVTSFGSCQQLNVKCICSDTQLISNLACCVSKNCNQADQEQTIQFADALCGGEGVTNLPTAATCAPGAASTPLGTSTASLDLSGLSSTAAASSASSASSAAAGSTTSSQSDGMPTGAPHIGLGMLIAGGLAML